MRLSAYVLHNPLDQHCVGYRDGIPVLDVNAVSAIPSSKLVIHINQCISLWSCIEEPLVSHVAFSFDVPGKGWCRICKNASGSEDY